MTPEARLRIESPPSESGQATAVVQTRNLESLVEQAISRSRDWMLAAQAQEGYWWGAREADAPVESDYILSLHILGQLKSEKTAKLARYIRERQLEDGGWYIFYGGPSELNATVKAYVALRLGRDAPTAPHMQRAKQKVLDLGGLEATNSYVRFYLAMVGAISWDMVPSIPPEMMLLPDWFPLNLYEMSSWTRGIVVPLAIVYANKPDWRLPEDVTVTDLFKVPGQRPPSFTWDKSVFTWRNAFLALERGLKLYERSSWKPFRKMCLARARKWMMGGLERSEGLATIYHGMMNPIFPPPAEAGDPDDPLLHREIKFLERYEIEDERHRTIRVQPCISPVWDTP